MSIPAHGIISGIVASYISQNPYFIGVSVLLGIYPDFARFIHGGGACKEEPNWKTYEEWHRLDILNLSIPFLNLHILIDYFLHRKEGGWNQLAYITETLFWITIGVIYL